jgi:hypothetical protein
MQIPSPLPAGEVKNHFDHSAPITAPMTQNAAENISNIVPVNKQSCFNLFINNPLKPIAG